MKCTCNEVQIVLQYKISTRCSTTVERLSRHEFCEAKPTGFLRPNGKNCHMTPSHWPKHIKSSIPNRSNFPVLVIIILAIFLVFVRFRLCAINYREIESDPLHPTEIPKKCFPVGLPPDWAKVGPRGCMNRLSDAQSMGPCTLMVPWAF